MARQCSRKGIEFKVMGDAADVERKERGVERFGVIIIRRANGGKRNQ